MRKVKLGNSELSVGAIAYGCWRQCEISVKDSQVVIEGALEAGLTLIDAADIYGFDDAAGFGGAEEMLGKIFKGTPHLRDEMVLATKGGIRPPVPYDSSYDYLVEACENSLKRLQVEQVDLYHIHRPDLLTPMSEVARALTHLVESGKAAHVGVSNYTTSQFRALQTSLEFPLLSHQPELSLVTVDPIENGLLDQCQELDLTCFAWSPLAGGVLPTGKCPDGMDAILFDGLMAKLDEMAAKYSATRTQIALAFLLKLPARVLPIVGTQRLERVRDAAGAVSVALSVDDWYALYEARRGEGMP